MLSSICSFSKLEQLVLKGTALNETVPACMGQLKSLQVLDVSNSKLLHGALPSLGALASLRSIDLAGAAFTGLPKDVCDLPAAALTNATCAMAGNPLDCTDGPLPMCVRPCGAQCATGGSCTGSSSYLTEGECGVWHDLSSQPAWQQAQPCADPTDPCACAGGKVGCIDDHTLANCMAELAACML